MIFLKKIYWPNSIVVLLSLLIIASCNELEPGDLSFVGIDDTEVSNREDSIAFTVQLSESSEFDVTVDFATSDQSAKAGEDYVDTTGTITFEAGETEQKINVELLGATFNAPHRRFRVKLDNPEGAEIHNRKKQATGIILNTGTGLMIHDAEASRLDEEISFKVTHYGDSDEVSIDFSTFDQSAKSGTDYIDTTGTLNFEPGQNEQYINIKLLGASFNAPHRRFRMRLDNPVGAELHNRDRQATGIILNEEDGISLDISDAEAAVGDDEISFPVTLSEAPDDEVRVDFATKDQSAKAGEDYAETVGTLVFEAGQTEQVIDVELLGAAFRSQGRKFRMELENAIGATLKNNNRQATGTILNNETEQVNLSIDDAEAIVGEEAMNFQVTLSDAAQGEVKVDFETSGRSAKAGEDYVESFGTLTFEEGQVEKMISVDLLGAPFNSPERKFSMKLDNAAGAELKNSERQATGTILNNEDEQVTVAISDAEAVTGDEEISFPVKLSGSIDQEVSVDFSTSDQSAKAGENYEETIGTLTFAEGETEQTIDVKLLDSEFSGNSIRFTVTLSNPSGIELDNQQNKADGTISSE